MSTKRANASLKEAPTKANSTSQMLARAVHAAICVSSFSLAVSTAKQILTPLFGSVATNLFLQKAVLTTTVVLSLLPSRQSALALGAVLALAPVAFHQIGSRTSRMKDPVFGPIVAYMSILAPVAWLTVGAVKGAMPKSSAQSNFRNSISVFSGIGIALSVAKTNGLWPSVPIFAVLSQPLLLVISAWLVSASSEISQRLGTSSKARTASQKSYHFLKLVPLLLTTFLTVYTPPTRPLTLPHTVYNATDSSPLVRVLSSTQSVTGRIVVAENFQHGFRYLRADHSLLGGVWLGDKAHSMDRSQDAYFARDVSGEKLGDSIYSAFVLQEAVRLVERERTPERALMIGLGAGVSAAAFSRHGLNTTIVEIDPAVYAAARDYFGLGLSNETIPRGGVYLEDAHGWVQRKAAELAREQDESEKFDFVVHDCFSGGGVPEQLFTMEFWAVLKKVVKEDGVLAVNFVGHIDSNPSKAILATLERSFGQCKVFHDYHLDVPEDKIAAEFINIVYFCTPSVSPELSFRPAVHSDYLNSYLRDYILRDFPKREVRLDLIRGELAKGSDEEEAKGYILRDGRNMLGAWEDEAALEHWGLMRSIMDAVIWETY